MIRWKDHSSCDSWISENEVDKYAALAECWSVGWLIKETEEAYVINAAFGENGSYGGIQTIGKGAPIEVRVLKKAGKACRKKKPAAVPAPAGKGS
jgi:hypothetical protein